MSLQQVLSWRLNAQVAECEQLKARVKELEAVLINQQQEQDEIALAKEQGRLIDLPSRNRMNKYIIDHEEYCMCPMCYSELKTAYAELEQQLAEAQKLVNRQAEDKGLWFQAQTAPESYLQQELRKLHAVIEHD